MLNIEICSIPFYSAFHEKSNSNNPRNHNREVRFIYIKNAFLFKNIIFMFDKCIYAHILLISSPLLIIKTKSIDSRICIFRCDGIQDADQATSDKR